jgi:alpha-ribazole phosphatase/probable phosphoglycerate mutase
MGMTRLFLIRHGQVVNHHERRYNGHHDVDITEFGVEQMTRLRDALKGEAFGAIYSSDLKRSLKGAAIIGAPLGLEPSPVEELRELALGRWEGLTRDEAVKRFPEEASFTFADLATSKVQGGENLIDLRERVLPALNEIIKANPGNPVCIVAHGGVNRVVLSDAMGLDLENFFRFEQDYGCLNIIDYHGDGVKVVKLLNGGPNSNTNSTELY